MIHIVDYDPQWPLLFDDLNSALAGALGALVVAIEHVGSTAVPGLAAKPIIDLDLVIEAEERLPAVIGRLSDLGYVHQGNLGIAGREAFDRMAEDVPRNDVILNGTGRIWPNHHLYVCPQDSRELARHLAFRDYLRQHPEQAAAYGRLKRDLARSFSGDREAYNRGKTEFIESIYLNVL